MNANDIRVEIEGTELPSVDIEVLDEALAQRLEWAREHAVPLPIRFQFAERDTEAHVAKTVNEVVIDILLDDEDDVEGHAIRMRFASQEDAAAFRRRVLASGTLQAVVNSGSRVPLGLPGDGAGARAGNRDDGYTAGALRRRD